MKEKRRVSFFFETKGVAPLPQLFIKKAKATKDQSSQLSLQPGVATAELLQTQASTVWKSTRKRRNGPYRNYQRKGYELPTDASNVPGNSKQLPAMMVEQLQALEE